MWGAPASPTSPDYTSNQLQPGFLDRGRELRLVPREVKSLMVRWDNAGAAKILPSSDAFVQLEVLAPIVGNDR